ncbi:methionine--tRNA ligase subunit beta [Thermogymnomonas acidicola]|uniref:methionine--tRNA ligase subunit beta n=1 Tax=Thermogymnomonas acidicola TaxID=399579 RepID=UPI0009464FAC|nr:methionine--tRNA ligase subunit beta [Thermogymnomonas acidicola]
MCAEELVDIDYFKKLDIRTALVKHCEKVEKSKRLLRLVVSLGSEERQIISSIADYYRPEELVGGKTIIILANLKPAKFMGLESQGMLLAVETEDRLALLTVDREIGEGLRVS